jgi:hypothetical protein
MGSPLSGRIFRECAARFGFRLADPSAALGTEDRCRHALEEAGFDRPKIIPARVDFKTLDPTLAWEANFRAAGDNVARALSAEQQHVFRQQFIDTLNQATQVDPATATRVDALFAIGQRASP